MWFLKNQKARALCWYNRVFMPLGVLSAGSLSLTEGLLETNGMAGVLLVCRKVA